MPSKARKLSREIEMFLSWWSATKSAGALQIEAKLNAELSSMFQDLADQVIEKLGDRLLSPEMQKGPVSTVIDAVCEKLQEMIFNYTAEAAQQGALGASAGMAVDSSADLGGSLYLQMKERVFAGAESTMDRVKGDVMGYLADAYDQGLGIDEAARLLRDNVFDGLKDWEAERIARTEIHAAAGEGVHQVIDDYGDYRQWLTAEDDRVRDGSHGDADHESMHGQIVRAGDPYSNGLAYPGDPSGDASEIINCRCLEVAFEMPEGKMAPEGMDYFYEEDLVDIDLPADAEAA